MRARLTCPRRASSAELAILPSAISRSHFRASAISRPMRGTLPTALSGCLLRTPPRFDSGKWQANRVPSCSRTESCPPALRKGEI